MKAYGYEINSGEETTIIGLLILLVCCLLLFVGPYFTIISLNLLFNLEVPVNLYTWLAAFWLTNILTFRASSKSDS